MDADSFVAITHSFILIQNTWKRNWIGSGENFRVMFFKIIPFLARTGHCVKFSGGFMKNEITSFKVSYFKSLISIQIVIKLPFWISTQPYRKNFTIENISSAQLKIGADLKKRKWRIRAIHPYFFLIQV